MGALSTLKRNGRLDPRQWPDGAACPLMDRLFNRLDGAYSGTAGARPLPIRRQLPTGEKRGRKPRGRGIDGRRKRNAESSSAAGATTGCRASLSS